MDVAKVAGVATLALALVACGPARRSAALGNAPELTAEQARGEIVFMEHCNACHVGGASALAPALNDKPLPSWMIALQVRYGFGAMPAFSEERISEAEMDDLTAYLKALRRTD